MWTGLSVTHPRMDICDLWAKQDKFGLGPGVYPKAKAPKAPMHPFCRCVVSPWLDIPANARARLRPGSEPAYLRSVGKDDAARVMGSKLRRDAVLNGADPLDVWNSNSDPMYRVRLVGDVARDGTPGLGAGAMTPTAQKMLDGLVELASSGGDDLLRTIFDDDKSYEKHVKKRLLDRDIESVAEYGRRTFRVFAQAEKITIVEPVNEKMLPTGKMQLTDGTWIVLVGERGNVVTSYPLKGDKVSFEQRHKAIGDKIYEQDIPNSYRQALVGIFGADCVLGR